MSLHSATVSGYKYFEIQILDPPVADKGAGIQQETSWVAMAMTVMWSLM